jgi:hypothetical protein
VLWFFVILFFAVAGISLYNGFTTKHEHAPNLIATASGILIGLTAVIIKLAWNDFGNRFWEHGFRHALLSPFFWMIFILPVITLVLDQIAIQRGKAIIVIPIITGMSNIIPIIIGILAMHEPMPSTGVMLFIRLSSLVLIIGGSIILSLRKEENGEPKPAKRAEALA